MRGAGSSGGVGSAGGEGGGAVGAATASVSPGGQCQLVCASQS